MAFSSEEMAQRRSRAQHLMDEAGLDAIMVTGDFSACMNYYYLSGHSARDYQSNFSRPHIMVLKKDGDASLLVYNVNRENAQETSWVREVRTYAPPFDYRSIQQLLEDMRLSHATIGAELGTDQRLWMPVEQFLRLRDALPSTKFVDGSDVLWRLRMIKSPAEIECIRTADRINARALRRAFSELKEGSTEKEVTRLVCRYLVDEGAWRPPHTQILVVSEQKARVKGHRARMLGPTDDRLQRGHVLFVDSGAIYEGYWGEFNRMAVVGPATKPQTESHDKIRTVVRRSIAEAFGPGKSFRSVIQHMVKIYQELGLGEEQYARYIREPFFHLAHGIGLNGSEPPFVRMDREDPLEVGMVMSVEAYLSHDGITYGSEEDIVITTNGAEILSDPDQGLFEIF